MLTKIIYKNFRSNLKNYILFFLSNIVAIMELFVFYGIRSIIKSSITDKVTAEALKTDFQIAVGIIAVITLMLMFYAMKCYIKLRIKDYSMFLVQIPLHRITDSASNGSVFPVVTEHFSASSDHAFL